MRVLILVTLVPLLSLATARCVAQTGEQIYRGQCAKCHGAAGEGTKTEYDQPLAGNRSVPQLAKYIFKSMPPDDPETIPVADAEKVAGYIHDAFYSKEARERNKPPRIDLARLTVNQYRQTVFDIVGGLQWSGIWGEKRGLKGDYFPGRGFNKDKRLIERTDAEVRFDFGTGGPGEKFDPLEFSIRWSGAVYAPETGEYEFVVRSDQAVNLWVNDNAKPLIDAWVKSGTDTEFRGNIALVGGRAYPIKLEFSKAKQGVQNDPNKNKPKPVKPAMVELQWRRPGRAVETLPSRYLAPDAFPESYVCTTPFPPDDRSYGWERGTTVSREWERATTEAALETAAYLLPRAHELAGTKPEAPDRVVKLKAFGRKFAELAFRRPLSDAEARAIVDRPFDANKDDPAAAVKRLMLLVLKSPRFLYREAEAGPAPHSVASRLSYALWDTMPDAELRRAASDGSLTTPSQVRKQAERLARDPRAEAKLSGLLQHWLGLDQAHELSKNRQRFPDFDATLAHELQTSLELALSDIVRSPEADFRRLLLEDRVYLSERLAKFYGVPLPLAPPSTLPSATRGFVKGELDPGRRLGLLMHPYLLANYAYTAESSPIHRGVFLARGVLGLTLKPPTEAFTPFAAELHPKLTTRERTDLQTGQRSCQACHSLINPLGFTFEAFDAVGRYRPEEGGKPVDSSGAYLSRAGDLVKFGGAADLAKYLAASPEVHDSFVEQLFHHLAQQPIRAYGPRRAAELREAFAGSGYNIRALAVEAAVTAALLPSHAEPPPQVSSRAHPK